MLDQAIRKGRLTMVDMGYDREVSDHILITEDHIEISEVRWQRIGAPHTVPKTIGDDVQVI